MTIPPFRFITILSLCAVTSGSGQSLRVRTADPIADMVQRISESSYTSYVLGLESFGTRHALQPNRDSVASWLEHQFLASGLTDVRRDSFSFSTTRQWNVVATFAGSDPLAGEIVVGGHYDSQSSDPAQAPGADDNASGTAAVLEMARVLHEAAYTPRHSLRFVAFGAEEVGLVGSERFAAQMDDQGRTVALMLNFDMIGTRRADQADRDVYIVWYEGAYDEARRDSAMMSTYTTLTPSLTTEHRTQSDSWPFALRGIKSVFHIERDFSAVYHSPHDSSTRLDFAYATDVVRGGLAMLLASDGLTATAVAETSVPTEQGLEQNYPNPFNGETVIRYGVEGGGRWEMGDGDRGPRLRSDRGSGNAAWVSLRVYDLLGQLVATVVEGSKEPGSHSALWNAAGLPSGTYVARLTVSDGQHHQTDFKKMTMIR